MTEETGGIVAEVAKGVLTLTIDRPGKKNALTLAMYDQLRAGLERAVGDRQIRCVLVRGSETVFTAGNDLHDFLDRPPTSMDSPVGHFLTALIEFPKPLVAAVAGPAVGIGTTMLLHCDLVYAARNARFQLPFVRLGLCPEAASSYLLPRLVGHQRAAELLYLGEPFDAATATSLGLVNAVVATDELLRHAASRAAHLAALPPAAMRITKRLLLQGRELPVNDALLREAEQVWQRLRSGEAKEAIGAVLEKRAPDFSRFE